MCEQGDASPKSGAIKNKTCTITVLQVLFFIAF